MGNKNTLPSKISKDENVIVLPDPPNCLNNVDSNQCIVSRYSYLIRAFFDTYSEWLEDRVPGLKIALPWTISDFKSESQLSELTNYLKQHLQEPITSSSVILIIGFLAKGTTNTGAFMTYLYRNHTLQPLYHYETSVLSHKHAKFLLDTVLRACPVSTILIKNDNTKTAMPKISLPLALYYTNKKLGTQVNMKFKQFLDVMVEENISSLPTVMFMDGSIPNF